MLGKSKNKYTSLKQKRMTRSFKVLFSSVVGAAVLLSVSSMAFAQTMAKDTTAPSDVETLSVTSGDGSVLLKWESATDDVAVKGYKIYYGNDEVKSTNDAKYTKTVDVANMTTHTVKNLENAKKYFFAVTAYDAAKNESESYSPYVSAVPMNKLTADTTTDVTSTTTTVTAAGAADTTAPTVSKAEALNKVQIRVTFSEPVKLPAVDTDLAFTVQDNYTYENLKIKSVTADAEDKTGTMFILETEEQSPGSEYIVTAGIQIEDLAGNPINSGTSDTGSFTGSSMTKEAYVKQHPAAPIKDASAPKDTVTTGDSKVVATADADAASSDFTISSVAVENDTTLKVNFSKPAVFSIDPSENFELVKKGDTVKLELSSILIDDNKTDVLIATTMEPGVEYTLKAKGVLDATGKALAAGKDTFDFKSTTAAPADTTPPEDVTNLVINAVKNIGAKLKWVGSKNAAGDLLEYMIYHSTDDKAYGPLTALAKENTAFEAKDLQPGVHYFKVTAKDASGNESAGKIVKVKLAETGPGLALVAVASVGLGRVFGKKKTAKTARK